jgi:hypothetical protein
MYISKWFITGCNTAMYCIPALYAGVQISALRPVILAEGAVGFLQSLQVNARKIAQFRS